MVGSLVAPTELLGSWRLERRLADRTTDTIGRVTGTLRLSRLDDQVSWSERGVLSWAGRTMEVYRELRIRPEGAGWMVCFTDGREFHPWLPGESVLHPCRADRYTGLVLVDRDRRRLRVGWDVVGPAKHQRILTRCYRLG